MPTCAIYTRISRDDAGDEAGVQRQEEDCRELAERLGFEVAEIFTDNDRGASTLSRKQRPAYTELMLRARAGEWDAILAYSSSRLTRRPRESEDVIELVERYGVQLHTVASGVFDLSTADGRAGARTVAAWNAAEAERTGERVRRAFLQHARQGKRHGAVPFGWKEGPRRPGGARGPDVLDEAVAKHLQQAARDVLDGTSLRAIALRFQALGLPTPRARGAGSTWNGVIVKQLLLRPSNSGAVTYKGERMPDVTGDWETLWDESTQTRLRALLTDPRRTKQRGTERKYLLSGLLLCGKCGAPCRTIRGGLRKDRKDVPAAERTEEDYYPRAYTCGSCHGVRRRVDVVDWHTGERIKGRLRREDVPPVPGGAAASELQAAQVAREAIEAELQDVAGSYTAGRITLAQMETVTAAWRPRLEAAERAVLAAEGRAELAGAVTTPEQWEHATLAQRRRTIAALAEVTLLPGLAGGAWDPTEHLRVAWRERW